MYNPLELSQSIEKIVCRDRHRKYFRFRATRYYGGISTGDVVGCNLKCCYCYVFQPRERPAEIGRFYSPEEAASILIKIAEKHEFSKIRLSGGEPTICRRHLIKLLETIPDNFTFIVETNGILLGYDKTYVIDLAKFDNVLVRVSLKGCTPQEFSKITGATPQAFEYQLLALKNCIEAGVECYPAILLDIIDKKNLPLLKKRLDEIDESLWKNLDTSEVLLLYPHVKRRMEAVGFKMS
mgnify:FL=1